jgi:cellulose synthase/poly-beta-1,6-N-acetylglucosamine synthase-like glycosyltransferase
LIEIVLGVATAVYLAGAAFLVVFTASFGVLLGIYLFTRRRSPTLPQITDDQLPSVTVQLPVYNEPQVVDRLVDACVCLDYPAGKLHIQILDDSTDHTSQLIVRKLRDLRSRGLDHITHIHRDSRDGYKAGALAYALRDVQTECVAVFDADFVPQPDFLRRTMPYFSVNPRLGLVQTRWEHLNVDHNLLTRVQALGIDAHFAIEQVARSRGKLPMSMNGSGGIWRVATIQDAGGWSSATLTEDMDLSYRAFLCGWEFVYLVDVAVPGELPPLVHAYKLQQARWATGSTQCLLQHLPTLLCARVSPLKKLMGFMHLAQYAIQPVILVLFLLTPLFLWGNLFQHLPNPGMLAAVGLIPPLVIALAQFELHDDWLRRLLYFPAYFVAAVAIVLNNSSAVLMALWPSGDREFWRTPKFYLSQDRRTLRSAAYKPQIDIITLGEIALAVYACFGLVIALERFPAFVPYLLLYAFSFSFFVIWNVYQALRFKRVYHRAGVQTGT